MRAHLLAPTHFDHRGLSAHASKSVPVAPALGRRVPWDRTLGLILFAQTLCFFSAWI